MASSTTLQLGRDKNGYVTYELPWSEQYYETTLVASVAQSITVPANTRSVFFKFSPGLNVFVQKNGGAIGLPGAAFAQVANKTLDPGAKHTVEPGDVLQFISDTNAFVAVEFYNKKLGTV